MKTKNLIFVTILAFVFFSCEKDETFRIVKFDADKTCATNITQTTAVLQTSLIEVNPGDCGLEGFIYFEYADYPEYFSGHMKASGGLNRFWEVKCETDRWMQEQPIAQTYSANISDLTPGTTYYFAPVIDGTSYYGEVKSFTTLGEKSITVTTGDATNIGTNCATLNGKCTLKNGATLKEAGILLNTSSSISLGNYITKFSGTRTSFSAKPDDLLSNTTYYFCAYAIESSGQVFLGNVKSFKTLLYKAPLSDFIGTYSVKYDRGGDDFNAYDFPDPKDQTTCSSWNYDQTGTATISKITAPSGASGQWVKMTFTPNEGSSWSLSGKYDENKYCICLYGDVAGDYTIPGLNASGSICPDCGVWAGMFYGHFTMPIYKFGNYIYLLSSGYGYKGSVEIQLVKSGPNAQIEFNAPNKDKNFGYYPNGIGHYRAWCGSPDSQGSFHWGTMDGGVEYVNLTFTKQ